MSLNAGLCPNGQMALRLTPLELDMIVYALYDTAADSLADELAAAAATVFGEDWRERVTSELITRGPLAGMRAGGWQ
jgi:hypothetical protein